jgi:hypothetical protein
VLISRGHHGDQIKANDTGDALERKKYKHAQELEGKSSAG